MTRFDTRGEYEFTGDSVHICNFILDNSRGGILASKNGKANCSSSQPMKDVVRGAVQYLVEGVRSIFRNHPEIDEPNVRRGYEELLEDGKFNSKFDTAWKELKLENE